MRSLSLKDLIVSNAFIHIVQFSGVREHSDGQVFDLQEHSLLSFAVLEELLAWIDLVEEANLNVLDLLVQ